MADQKPLLLVVALTAEEATKYKQVAEKGGYIEAKAFSPPNGLDGLLAALRKNGAASAILITADKFVSLDPEPGLVISSIRVADPDIHILILKVGNRMSHIESMPILRAGANGLYHGTGLQDANLSQWIVSGTFGHSSKRPVKESALQRRRGSVVPVPVCRVSPEERFSDDGFADSENRDFNEMPGDETEMLDEMSVEAEKNGERHPALPATLDTIPALIQPEEVIKKSTADAHRPNSDDNTSNTSKGTLMSTTQHDLAAISASLAQALQRLSEAASHYREMIAYVEEIAVSTQQASSELLQDVRNSAKKTSGASVKSKKATHHVDAKRTQGRHEVEIAGRTIILTGGQARVMNYLLGSKHVCPKEKLTNGGTERALSLQLNKIRQKLTEVFGKKGAQAIVNHRGKGYSFNSEALH